MLLVPGAGGGGAILGDLDSSGHGLVTPPGGGGGSLGACEQPKHPPTNPPTAIGGTPIPFTLQYLYSPTTTRTPTTVPNHIPTPDHPDPKHNSQREGGGGCPQKPKIRPLFAKQWPAFGAPSSMPAIAKRAGAPGVHASGSAQGPIHPDQR